MSRPTAPPSARLALLLALLLSLAGPAARAQDAASAEDAARAAERQRITELQAQAKALRDEAEATYQATEPACYERFLVNRCIAEAFR